MFTRVLMLVVRPSIDRYQLKDVRFFIKFNHWCEINTIFYVYIIYSAKALRFVKRHRESAENQLMLFIHIIFDKHKLMSNII